MCHGCVSLPAFSLLRSVISCPVGDEAPQVATDTGLLLPGSRALALWGLVLFSVVCILMSRFSLTASLVHVFPFTFGPLMDSASLLLPLGIIKERSGEEEAVCPCL